LKDLNWHDSYGGDIVVGTGQTQTRVFAGRPERGLNTGPNVPRIMLERIKGCLKPQVWL
jgi:hypothetical protein